MIISLKFDKLATFEGSEGAFFKPKDPKQKAQTQFLNMSALNYMLHPTTYSEKVEAILDKFGDNFDIPTAELKKAIGEAYARAVKQTEEPYEKSQQHLLFFRELIPGVDGEAPLAKFTSVLKKGENVLRRPDERFTGHWGNINVELTEQAVVKLLNTRGIRSKDGRYIPEHQLVKALEKFHSPSSRDMHFHHK